MLKALIKKQFLELASFFLQSKDGKRRSVGVVVAFVALMVYALAAAGVMFWFLCSFLCAPLVEAGQGWIYFAFMAVLSTTLGVVGGVFMAKAALYEAKDNDLLFSLPIPAWAILFTRVVGLYIFTLPFEACVFIPAVVNYVSVTGFSFVTLIGGVLIQFVLPLIAVAICCLLGFVLSWATEKLPFKNAFIVLGFLAFMVGYSLLSAKMNEYLGMLVQQGEAIGGVMKTWLYPFSQLGHAMTGDLLSLAVFIGISLALFCATYAVLSATYLWIATRKGGGYRAKYKEKKTGICPPWLALFKKEFWRLMKTPAYLLNSSMGAMMMLIVAVMMAIYGDFFGINADMVASIPFLSETIGLIVAAVVCLMAAMNTMSACSISLEGKSLGLAQSMPVSAWNILKAKLYLHIVFTALPDAILGIAMALVLKLEWFTILGVVLTAVIGSVLFACVGLFFNLKLPNLNWTSETVAVKQGLSVLFSLCVGLGLTALPIGIYLGAYYLFNAYLPAPLYLYLWLIVFAVLACVLLVWLKKRGAEIFRALSA